MSLFDDILKGVTGFGGLGLGIVQDKLNYDIGMKNYQLQQEQLAYQKGVQQTTWNREDSAVQRRVADLRAAGLNPVLAAGSAAGTSAPIQVTSPRREAVNISSGLDKANVALAVMSALSDISRTRAQNKLLDMQANKTALESEGVLLDNWRSAHDNEYYAKYGIPSSGAGITKDILNAFEAIKSRSSVLGNTSIPFLDKLIDKFVPKSTVIPGRFKPSHGGGKSGGW